MWIHWCCCMDCGYYSFRVGRLNNGIRIWFRCGFAQTQEAYDAAVSDLFGTLDMLEDHLESSRYLCGDSLTIADVCLFTTLIRFDLVYNVMFKCTKKKIVEYPNLYAYMRDIYQVALLSCFLFFIIYEYVCCILNLVFS